MENDFDLKQSFEDAIKTIVRSYAVVDGTIKTINNDNTCESLDCKILSFSLIVNLPISLSINFNVAF